MMPNTASTPNPSLLGYMRAYDLRPDVHEDPVNGGITFSSVTKKLAPPTPTPADLGIFYSCITNTIEGQGELMDYDTDVYLGKFDVNGKKLWEEYFDRPPTPRPRVPYSGDVRRKECAFKMCVADDGGYVLAGNCSPNFDDDYLVKMYSSCSASQTYTKYDVLGSNNNFVNIFPPGVTTWTGNQKVLGSFHIQPNATLLITGASTVIEFAEYKYTGITTNIVVEPGGKLIVSGGAKLTSMQSCPGTMWDGIILKGTASPQAPTTNQGVAILSGGTIENARVGIQVGANSTGINNGAIIQANNFTFRNNNVDVQFNPYKAPFTFGNEPNNKSYFTLCNFIGDHLLNDASYFIVTPGVLRSTSTHVSLNQVKGIYFNGCTFKTDLSTLPPSYITDGWGFGIYSINSIFTVRRACNLVTVNGCGGQLSTFTNLLYGIYTQSTNPLRTFTATECSFTNCYASLYESGINYSTVTKNNFLINMIIPSPVFTFCGYKNGKCPTYFHYLNQCNGFIHQENNFSVTSSQGVIGTIFNKTGSTPNLTYRNTYSGLMLGTQTQTNNPGLQIQCNKNSGVTRVDIVQTSGTLPNQGACSSTPSTLANNTFSHFSSIFSSDINNASNSPFFAYNYNSNPSSGAQVPLYTSNVLANNCGLSSAFNYPVDCPSMLSSGCGIMV
jgi:hypothetical protein